MPTAKVIIFWQAKRTGPGATYTFLTRPLGASRGKCFFSPRYFLFPAIHFFLPYKKVFVTNFVTHITNFVTRVSKFVTHISKFVTNFFRADSENFQGISKKHLGHSQKYLPRDWIFSAHSAWPDGGVRAKKEGKRYKTKLQQNPSLMTGLRAQPYTRKHLIYRKISQTVLGVLGF